MAQLGDTIVNGDLNILGDLHVGGASNIGNNNNVKVLYDDKEIALTSEMQNIPLNSPSSNYNFLMIALRSGWNYTSTWIIPKIDYGRNNICPVFDNEGNFDLAYSRGITDTKFPVQNKKPLGGVVLMSIWGLFPTTSANSNIQGTTDLTGLLNLFYPVGSYYETSDANFNPNTSWGGTWVQDTKGQVMVSKSDTGTFNTVGNNIGSETKTLVTDNLPAHNHGLNSHTHTYDKSNGTSGSTTLTIDQIPAHSHTIFKKIGSVYAAGTDRGGVDTNNTQSTGTTGGGKGHTHTVSVTSTNTGKSSGNTADTGKGTAFSVVQNSKVCIRWHRTA